MSNMSPARVGTDFDQSLQVLLGSYECHYTFDQPRSQLGVCPQSGCTGREFDVYGTFWRDGLDSPNITGIAFLGFRHDPTDEEIDNNQELYLQLIQAILDGRYEYTKRKGRYSFFPRFRLTLYSTDKHPLWSGECGNSRKTNVLYKRGELSAVPYIRKANKNEILREATTSDINI